MADAAYATESALLAGLRARESAAYRRLIELNSANIYGVALKLLGNEQEAEDVLQETFLSAFRAFDRFEGRSRLSTWLYRIAYNASLMRLRKRDQMDTISLDRPVSDDDEGGESMVGRLVDWSKVPEDQLLTAEAREEMEKAIADLPESLRSAFVLRDIQGLSGAETAEILGISVQAVKNRLHRARLWLRKRLSEYFAEQSADLRAAA